MDAIVPNDVGVDIKGVLFRNFYESIQVDMVLIGRPIRVEQRCKSIRKITIVGEAASVCNVKET